MLRGFYLLEWATAKEASFHDAATAQGPSEATLGTAPGYANLDEVNPGSVALSGETMLRYLGWTEAADLVVKGMDGEDGLGQFEVEPHTTR